MVRIRGYGLRLSKGFLQFWSGRSMRWVQSVVNTRVQGSGFTTTREREVNGLDFEHGGHLGVWGGVLCTLVGMG